MRLTTREAATIMGRSRRTVRAQVARGDLPGVKRNGQWTIERRHLPLTEAQRRKLQRKASGLRRAVDEALPPRLARALGDSSRSLADLAAFRLGLDLAAEIRSSEAGAIPDAARHEVLQLLEHSLLAVAEAAHQYDCELKLEALNRARAGMARAAARLLFESGGEPAEPVAAWLAALEGEVLGAVAGYARWADKLKERRR